MRIKYYILVYRMNCNKDIHEELINMEEVVCPFCDQQLMGVKAKSSDTCCDKPDVISDNGMKVCKHCGPSLWF